MNKEWSELNKLMQTQIKKKDTYDSGIGTLFSLRDNLWDMIISFKDELSREEFNAIPYINAEMIFLLFGVVRRNFLLSKKTTSRR